MVERDAYARAMDGDDAEGGGAARRRNQSQSALAPAKLLALFCATSIVVYTDRGIISSAAVSGVPRSIDVPRGSGLQGALDASYSAYGALTAAFMIGLLCGCPTFSALARDVNPFRLISYGLMLYVIGEVGCAVAPSYWFMFACRCLVGVGEASFVSLAAPFIDDYAPPARKTLWLATFYLCVPFGVAFGILFGGAVAPALGWRAPFALNACCAAPIAAYCFSSPPVRMRGLVASSSRASSPAPPHAMSRSASTILGAFIKDCRKLAQFKLYAYVACGYSFYTAVIGVYAVWGPKAGYAIFSNELSSPTNADMVLGGVTVLSGILGTLFGGFVVDTFGSTLPNALRTCACAAFAGFIFLEIAFRCSSFGMFLLFFIAGEMFAFVLQAPINAVVLWSVEPRLRPLACGMTTVIIHLFGDVPTPPLFGHFLERRGSPTPERWRAVCAGFTLLLVVSACILGGASVVAKTAVDYRRVDDAADDDDGGGGGGGDDDDDDGMSDSGIDHARLMPQYSL